MPQGNVTMLNKEVPPHVPETVIAKINEIR